MNNSVRFKVSFELDGWEVDDGVIELDQKVIDQVDDEWRSFFYPSMDTPERVAEMIAYNLVVNNTSLSGIDGFADLDDDMARMIEWPMGLDDFDVIAERI